jgi:hypothetical protein
MSNWASWMVVRSMMAQKTTPHHINTALKAHTSLTSYSCIATTQERS